MTLEIPHRRNISAELRIALLGILAPDGKCDECSKYVGIRRLEIDHVHGRDWSARALSKLQRAKRYWSEYLTGVAIRALCRHCNAAGGGRRYDRTEKAS
ncbi:MAG TPA: hypothetical protein VGL61_25720 [Kofleriaceae bacterium]